jgi:hypothetical protein
MAAAAPVGCVCHLPKVGLKQEASCLGVDIRGTKAELRTRCFGALRTVDIERCSRVKNIVSTVLVARVITSGVGILRKWFLNRIFCKG